VRNSQVNSYLGTWVGAGGLGLHTASTADTRLRNTSLCETRHNKFHTPHAPRSQCPIPPPALPAVIEAVPALTTGTRSWAGRHRSLSTAIADLLALMANQWRRERDPRLLIRQR
jgi:hypothetical protein